jgi:hypothetical protein
MKREQGTAKSNGDLEATWGLWHDDTMHHVPAVACQSDFVESGMGD